MMSSSVATRSRFGSSKYNQNLLEKGKRHGIAPTNAADTHMIGGFKLPKCKALHHVTPQH